MTDEQLQYLYVQASLYSVLSTIVLSLTCQLSIHWMRWPMACPHVCYMLIWSLNANLMHAMWSLGDWLTITMPITITLSGFLFSLSRSFRFSCRLEAVASREALIHYSGAGDDQRFQQLYSQGNLCPIEWNATAFEPWLWPTADRPTPFFGCK